MKIKLPEPAVESRFSLEQSLALRRSVRRFADEPLTLKAVAQLLWAAQGITHPHGYRTAPSAGALYPLEIYLVTGLVNGLQPGIYHYEPHSHHLSLIREGDVRRQLCDGALGQRPVAAAPAVFAVTAVYERTTGKYGRRGIRYVHLDAGHAAQNLCLQATALGLGTVPVGAFSDEQIAKTLQAGKDETVFYLLPVGRPR